MENNNPQPESPSHPSLFDRQILLFLALCFGFSWAIGALTWKLGGLASPFGGLLIFVFMWGPAFAALICTWAFDRSRWKQALGFLSMPNWVWLWAVGLAALIVVGATLLSLLGPEVHWIGFTEGFRTVLEAQGLTEDKLPMPLTTLVLLQLVVGLPIGIAINGVLLLSEELGWRGWLYDRWRGFGFWRGNLAIGFVWGLWHAPIIAMGHNYPDQPIAGIFIMIGFCLALAPIVGWFREVGRSVFAASIFHGTINALAGVGLMVVSNTKMPWTGVVGIGGFVMLAAVCAGLFLTRSRAQNSGST
jgi:membrane protease YdiL (CAAX protease family)